MHQIKHDLTRTVLAVACIADCIAIGSAPDRDGIVARWQRCIHGNGNRIHIKPIGTAESAGGDHVGHIGSKYEFGTGAGKTPALHPLVCFDRDGCSVAGRFGI